MNLVIKDMLPIITELMKVCVFIFFSNLQDIDFVGTAHAEDLDYFFIRSTLDYTETDLKVSGTLVLLWTNFAKTG